MNTISSDINKAIALLSNEDIVAIPTETVYGLAGNIFSEKAIQKIFKVKQRPLFNPLIVHIHSLSQVNELASAFPEKAQLLANAFWPGPLTLILPKKSHISDTITAGKSTVGIRMPNHPVALQLLEQLPFPLAAPSANPFNRISPTRASHVAAYFNEAVPMILEGGACKNGIESTIIGFEDNEPVLYRLGSTSKEAIERIIGTVKIKNNSEQTPNAPGMLAKHYAPKTKTYLVDNIAEFVAKHKQQTIGVLRFSNATVPSFVTHVKTLSITADLKEAAAGVYQALHELDGLQLDIIVAEKLPDYGLGASINDRLTRATK